MTEWRPVVGFEDLYEVSNKGGVRRMDRLVPHGTGTRFLRAREIQPYTHASGHRRVRLYRDGIHHRYVHRMVLEAFIGACPPDHECCHRDGDPANNNVENLYWGTASDNTQDRVRHGSHNFARKTHCPAGHEYNAQNTYLRPDRTGRCCRICQRAASQRHRARQRAMA